MNISSATSSLFFGASRYGDEKKNDDGVKAFLDILSGGKGDLSSLQVKTPDIDGLPVEKAPQLDGLPVERQPQIDGLPVEPTPEPEVDGLPVEPQDPYVDPQILLTQKLAASLMNGAWRSFDPPAAAA